MSITPMPSRILAAWREGTLVPSGAADGGARVEHIGRGETFEAWSLHPASGPPLTIRVPWRAAQHQAAAMSAEFEALHRVPPGIGPSPIAIHPDPTTSPLGAPCLVTTHRPGRALLPAEWTEEHLSQHARLLAALHRPGPAAAPDAPPRSPTWAQETGTLLEDALSGLGGGPGADPHRLRPILEAAARHCARSAARIDGISTWTLCHGDLCATNIVWVDGACSYIDFEWARTDDPARDLAIIGGSVHGGPWYVPMTTAQGERFVATYREAARRLGGEPEDAGALQQRRHDWTVYERTSMLVHLAGRSLESAEHGRVLPQIRSGLAALLGVG